MSIENLPNPSTREEIETAVGVLVNYLNSETGTDIVVRLNGALTDDQVSGIEQGILLVTERRVQLAHHYYAEPEDGETHSDYTVLGIVDEPTS